MADSPLDPIAPGPDPGPGLAGLAALAAAAAAIAAGAVMAVLLLHPSLPARPRRPAVRAHAEVPVADLRPYGELRDPASSADAAFDAMASWPLRTDPAAGDAVGPARPAAVASLDPVEPVAPLPARRPEPPPREARAPRRVGARLASLEAPPVPAAGPAVSPAPSALGILQSLFGAPAATAPALAYADPSAGIAPVASAATTATYDISAHVVRMPDGTRLEAHSGLRERADDPRFVREPMRGATPPAVYDLTYRESLFHGVQAIRLNPVAGDVYGRKGLLAHTYMLGGRPESNGCVVFRDYDAFLRAFREGRVRRLVVVPGVRDASQPAA